MNSRHTKANADPAIIEYLDYIRTNDDSGNYTTELLQKTLEKVQEVRSDERMEVSYMMWQLKYQDAVEEGRAKGREEGQIEGGRGAKIQIAHNLIDVGLPFDRIVNATGLTYEEVERLRTNI